MRPSRKQIALIAAAAVLAGAAAVTGLAAQRRATEERLDRLDRPAIGAAEAAVCPAVWREAQNPWLPFRMGRLVPEGARRAVLCTYRMHPTSGFSESVPRSRDLARGVQDLIGYLNDLPSESDVGCPAIGMTVGRDIVLEYADRPPAIVHIANCVVSQSGAAGYEYSEFDILDFWGLTPDTDGF